MLDIDSLRDQAGCALQHHLDNIQMLEEIDSEHHEAPALELKNTILVEVVKPLEEMILMLEMFSKMGLENVPHSMFIKWQIRLDCLLSRMGLVL